MRRDPLHRLSLDIEHERNGGTPVGQELKPAVQLLREFAMGLAICTVRRAVDLDHVGFLARKMEVCVLLKDLDKLDDLFSASPGLDGLLKAGKLMEELAMLRVHVWVSRNQAFIPCRHLLLGG